MNRKNKRRLKQIFFLIFAIFFLSGFAFGIYSVTKNLTLISLPKSKNEIVKPFIRLNDLSEFETKLVEKGIKIDSIKASTQSGDIIAELKDGPIVFFAGEKDIEWQVSSLQEIIGRLTIESKKPIMVDLRYSKPIVKF